MLVHELIAKLQKLNPDARCVVMVGHDDGYDNLMAFDILETTDGWHLAEHGDMVSIRINYDGQTVKS